MTNEPSPLQVQGISYTWNDIYQVVNSFYHQVQKDPLLKIPFRTVEDWPHHIERLTHFWWLRFGGSPYLDVRYDPVGKHFETGFNEHFLERWLELFRETLQKELKPEQAAYWFEMTQSMGVALSRNNELMHIRARAMK
jgi:hemoglobin